MGFEPDSRHEPATADGRTDAASTPKATGTREPVQQAAQLEAAIERVTRALATADDDTIAELVAERRAMREELRALREVSAGVVHIATRRTSG